MLKHVIHSSGDLQMDELAKVDLVWRYVKDHADIDVKRTYLIGQLKKFRKQKNNQSCTGLEKRQAENAIDSIKSELSQIMK